MARKEVLPGAIGDAVAKFSDEVLTTAQQSSQTGLWYAVIDVGQDTFVSDPDFSSAAPIEADARSLTAFKIRQDFFNVGKYAPHFSAYDAKYRLIKYWRSKKRKLGKIAATQPKLVWQTIIGGFEIRLEQYRNEDHYRVVYGQQVKDHLGYVLAAHELGEDIFHALNSNSQFDDIPDPDEG